MSRAENYAVTMNQAWQGNLSFPDLLENAAGLEAEGFPPLAAVLYQVWLSRTTASPYAHAANFNLGVTLVNLGEMEGAEAAYRRSIALSPEFAYPRLNLGLLHERLGHLDEATEEWKWIVQHGSRQAPTRSIVVLALNHLGRVQEGRKQYDEAVEYLTQSLLLDPNQPDALHHWVFLRQRQCRWPIYEEISGVSQESMREATSALAMLSISDDPQIQLAAAKRYVATKLAVPGKPLADRASYGHKKIRVAYCSSDFCLHPVSLLTVELLELHDREKFEVYGFCWSPEDGSALRQRVIAAMDHFIRIDKMSDEQAAQLIRSHEIDILVDLQGQTSGARSNMLGMRPAPIQITYLGLPATTGLPCIDYVIADEFLIPPDAAAFYTEKPLYMPHVYQVSDRQRPVGPKPTRAECGLPENALVLCSFNNSFKYTPDVFKVWMNVLKRVPETVLWLLADNPWAEDNLRQLAASQGIAAERLVFAKRVSPENYLARYQVADLFLDTFPFNAGTTANDSLWMGCPILTLAGRSFASRMAGALLTAAGLPELICHSLNEYEEAAVLLAKDKDRCASLRNQLTRIRESGFLFNTPLFVHDLEERFIDLVRELDTHSQHAIDS
jgi:predicted O-linked N-acetylglucosamine transferase (SPINDLY family)